MKSRETISWIDEVRERAYSGGESRAMVILSRMFLTGQGVEQSLIRALDIHIMAKAKGHHVSTDDFMASLKSVENIGCWEEEMDYYIHVSEGLADKSEDPYSVWIMARLLYTTACLAESLGYQERAEKCRAAIRKIDPGFLTSVGYE